MRAARLVRQATGIRNFLPFLPSLPALPAFPALPMSPPEDRASPHGVSNPSKMRDN
jgi:hypothetical protein